jgi:hypothetical protein
MITHDKAVYNSQEIVRGKYIHVHQMNIYFSHVTTMLLHYYDTKEYTDYTFILGDYIRHPVTHFRSLYPGRKIVAYQLEQLVGAGKYDWHNIQFVLPNIQSMDEVWEYDAVNAVFLSWHEVTPKKIVPVRYTPALRLICNHDNPDIDILFYGFVNERRFRFLNRMQHQFYNRLRFVHAYGIFGQQLDDLIARSKIILNLHSNEPYHRQEQVRIFYPLINGKCILSEKSQINWFGDAIVEFTDDTLGQCIERCMSDWQKIGQFGAKIFEEQTSTDVAYQSNIEQYIAQTK